MEINSRPLSQDKTERLRRWLGQPEFILLLEQLKYRCVLAESAALDSLRYIDEKPFAEHEAKKHAHEANRYRSMIETLERMGSRADSPNRSDDQEFIVVEVEPISSIIEMRTHHAKA